MTRHVGPVLCQHRPAKGIDLAEGDGLEASGALKTKGEAPDTAEQVQHAEPSRCVASASLCGPHRLGRCCPVHVLGNVGDRQPTLPQRSTEHPISESLGQRVRPKQHGLAADVERVGNVALVIPKKGNGVGFFHSKVILPLQKKACNPSAEGIQLPCS